MANIVTSAPPRDPGLRYRPQRRAAVWTGASQSAFISASSLVSVIEEPAISSEVQ